MSKILRDKDKYLEQEDGSNVPPNKAKGKLPDVGRALSKRAKIQRRQCVSNSDSLSREKAHALAAAVGNTDKLPELESTKRQNRFRFCNRLPNFESREENAVARTESGIASDSPNRASIPPSFDAESLVSEPCSSDINRMRASRPPEIFKPKNELYHSSGTGLLTTASSATTTASGAWPVDLRPPIRLVHNMGPFVSPGHSQDLCIGDQQKPYFQAFLVLGVESTLVCAASEIFTSTTPSRAAPFMMLGTPTVHYQARGRATSISLADPLHGQEFGLPSHASPSNTVLQPSPVTKGGSAPLDTRGVSSVEEVQRASEVMTRLSEQRSGPILDSWEYFTMGDPMRGYSIEAADLPVPAIAYRTTAEEQLLMPWVHVNKSELEDFISC